MRCSILQLKLIAKSMCQELAGEQHLLVHERLRGTRGHPGASACSISEELVKQEQAL
jgi:hypothetical protein